GISMPYSSGTTGRPKGILRPLPDVHPEAESPLASFITDVFQLRDWMTYLSPAPLYHAAPLSAVSGSEHLGATAILMERFDAEHFVRVVDERGVTHTQVVPTMFVRLLKLPRSVRRAADLSTLRAVVHAAAPCPVAVKREMIEWLGPIVYEYYAA